MVPFEGKAYVCKGLEDAVKMRMKSYFLNGET
jgi:hypothetical protein